HPVNKKVMESLIKSGAMDSLSPEESLKSRAKFVLAIDSLIAQTAKSREDSSVGQGSLFEIQEMVRSSPSLSSSAENGQGDTGGWSEHELLGFEKEVLGFYLSGHPLALFQGVAIPFS